LRYAVSSNSCELKFVDAIKNVAGGTVRHEAVSAGNSDLTLRIVKERQAISRSHASEAEGR
jgi:hypothetical protein